MIVKKGHFWNTSVGGLNTIMQVQWKGFKPAMPYPLLPTKTPLAVVFSDVIQLFSEIPHQGCLFSSLTTHGIQLLSSNLTAQL